MAAHGVAILVNPDDNTRGHIVLSDGSFVPRGTSTQITAPYRQNASQGRPARVVDAVMYDWDLRAGYVLDAWGGIHRFSDAALPPPLTGLPYWPNWDIARALVVRLDIANYAYVADGLGGVHRTNGAPSVSQGTQFEDDRIRALAVRRWDPSPWLYKLSRKGGILSVGGAPDLPALFDVDEDFARDLEVRDDGSAYYVLDALGGISPGGLAKPVKYPVITAGHDLYVEAWGPPARIWMLAERRTDLFFTTTTKPVMAFTGPSDPTIDDSYPAFRWTHFDVDGEAQERYRVKVFTEAQTLITGFDPGSSPLIWDSGERRGKSVRNLRPDIDLPPGDYVVYGRVWNEGGERSDWASSAWAQRVDGPAVPELTATPNSPAGKVALVAVGPDNLMGEQTASPEADPGSWHPIALGAAAALETSVALKGSASLRMTATGTGTMIYRGDILNAPSAVGDHLARAAVRDGSGVKREARIVVRRRVAGAVTHTWTSAQVMEI